MKKSSKPKTLKTLYRRANRVGGQLLSIEKMVRSNRSPEEILNLLFAIEGSVYSLIYKHFDPIIRRHLAALINDISDTENLSASFENFIAQVRENFPAYKLNDLPKVFYDLKQFR